MLADTLRVRIGADSGIRTPDLGLEDRYVASTPSPQELSQFSP